MRQNGLSEIFLAKRSRKSDRGAVEAFPCRLRFIEMINRVENELDLWAHKDADFEFSLRAIGRNRAAFDAAGLVIAIFSLTFELDGFSSGELVELFVGKLDREVARFVVEKIGEN